MRYVRQKELIISTHLKPLFDGAVYALSDDITPAIFASCPREREGGVSAASIHLPSIDFLFFLLSSFVSPLYLKSCILNFFIPPSN